MKIEKINDNQIRCTLTGADLAERELKLSELAYGTEKARSLFQDMMQQAAYEFGFEAEDIPLMIEAIPASSDSIVLIITKVEDPDELDTRFSKFSPAPASDADKRRASMMERLKKLEGADEFLSLLRHMKDAITALPDSPDTKESKEEETKEKAPQTPAMRLFSFSTLDSAIQASSLLLGMYEGTNTLYKDEAEDVYILALSQSEHTSADFNRICNMLSEYGSSEPSTGPNLAFLNEHCEVIVPKTAIQILGCL